MFIPLFQMSSWCLMKFELLLSFYDSISEVEVWEGVPQKLTIVAMAEGVRQWSV